jgi:beta-galactosidase
MDVLRIPGILYGGDYNPEQWDEDVWAEDASLMREAGVNLVTVGVFSWARTQLAPDRWDFGWLDRVMGLLHEHGVAVNLATASTSPPQWLIRRHPEIVPVDADGRRWSDNAGREHFCPSSPAYRDAVAIFVERLAERYRDHPALVMWHVNNEMRTRCYCDTSAAAFRRWLQERHQTLDQLNDAWGTTIWGQMFDDWSEVLPARFATANPAQALDWSRFSSDALLETYLAERAILQRITPGIPASNNWYGLGLRTRPRRGVQTELAHMTDHPTVLDHWRWGPHVDVVTSDEYPDPADPLSPTLAAIDYDLMRSIKGGAPWIVTEQTPGATAWHGLNHKKAPRMTRLWSLQMVAHGADGILFFQWRQSRFGPETFESGMVPHAGTRSHRWQEIRDLGRDLKLLAEVADSRTVAEVAVIHDQVNAWAFDLPGHPNDLLHYLDVLVDYYRPLHERNVPTEFVHPGGEMAPYRLVVIPNLFLVSDDAARRIVDYVTGGGVVLMGAFSGIVNERLHARLGGAPAPFLDLLGIRIEESYPQGPEGFAVRLDSGDSHAARDWCDWISLEGADAVAAFEGPLAGRPAITRNRFGAGTAWYVGTFLDEAGLGVVVDRVLADAGVRAAIDVPRGVEVTRRERDGASYLFLLNHTEGNVEITLDGIGGTDLLTGASVTGRIDLTARDAAVIRTGRTSEPGEA